MTRLLSLGIRYPRSTLALLAVITILLGLQAQKIRVDSAIDTLLPHDDPERGFYEEAKRVFGSEEGTVIGIFAPDVFAPATLARIDRLSNALAGIDGVREVISLTTVQAIEPSDGAVRIGRLLPELPRGESAAAAFRQRVLGDPLYAGNLVARDGTAAAVLVLFDPLGDQELLSRGVEDQISTLVAENPGPEDTAITGIQTLKVNGARLMEQDLTRFVPLSLLLVVAVLVWEFRTVRGVMLPLIAVIMGVIWTIGLMVLAGRSINMGTLILPPLLMAIGIAYAIHVVARYYQEIQPGRPRYETVLATLTHVRLPSVFAWLTTVLADATLSLSPIPAISDFGIFSALGITIIFLLSVVFIPAALVVLPDPKRTPRQSARRGRLARSLEQVARFGVARRVPILWLSAVVCALGLWGATRIALETDYLEFFGEESVVRRDNARVAEGLGGSQPVYVVIDGEGPRRMRKLESLVPIRDLQRFIERQPGVDSVLSVVDSVALVRRALEPGAAGDLPESQAEIDQLLQFLDPDQMAPVVSTDWKRANIVVRTRLSGSSEVEGLTRAIEDYARRLPEGMQARVTGSIVLLNRSADTLAAGQLSSLWQVMLVLVILMSSLFLSLRTGLLTLVPNVIPIVVLFGTMGFLGIDLNISTSMIAVIAIGIAVDDTIHYFNEYNLELRQSGDPQTAVVAVVRSVGQPIVFTALALSAGFLVLCLSNFQPIRQFGYLASLTMAVGLVTELLITPGLVTVTSVITLWDLLYVKLGPQPQKEIPLFRGLRALEARIVVLMARLASARPGDFVTRTGEMRAELYVLLNGQCEVRREDQAAILTLGRGDVIGEMGLVRARPRSANVVVTEPAEYLVLDGGFLDRLQRRHPRIASKVFLNLTRILADRLESTTDQLVVISRGIS